MEIILFLIAIFATTIGAIGGMSGGLIIKPAMDAVSGLDVSIISFMSSCTVLTMSSVSAFRTRKQEIDLNMAITLPLAVGGCIGGITGKSIFSLIPGDRAIIQSVLLAIIYLSIYIYALNKSKIKSLYIKNKYVCFALGCILGILSAFLGIGGGPINMAVLFYFIGSKAKLATKQSLFLVLLSQLGSFFTSLIVGIPPNINYIALGLMMLGGSAGAIIGSYISKKLNDNQIESFYKNTLIGVMVLNFYNIVIMVL